MRALLAIIALVAGLVPAQAQRGGITPPDPYVLKSGLAQSNVDLNGLTVRSAAINPALKTLVLITIGQSLLGNVMPSAYNGTNNSAIDQLNIFDGALYNVSGRLLGVTGVGIGNVGTIVADTLITNGKFDRVIMVPMASGGTLVAQWGLSGASLADRVPVAMRRLAARGITPATTGVTFAMLIGIGESDGMAGTSGASFTASVQGIVSIANAAGFSGRFFLIRETWISGVTYSTIQNAQSALVDNTTIWSGGDWDSLNASNRQVDNTHFSDAGGAAAAALTYSAMHASGAPY